MIAVGPRPYIQPEFGSRIPAEEQKTLLAEARAGDTQSADRLWPMAFSLILGRLKKTEIDKEHYPDIIQEWALEFFSTLGDYDETRGAGPSTFYFCRAQNTIRDYARRHFHPLVVQWREAFKPTPTAPEELFFSLADVQRSEEDAE